VKSFSFYDFFLGLEKRKNVGLLVVSYWLLLFKTFFPPFRVGGKEKMLDCWLLVVVFTLTPDFTHPFPITIGTIL